MVAIKKISSSETFIIRHPVLRKGKPIEACKFENDDAKTTLHLGYFNNNEMIGVISIFFNQNPIFNTLKQYQIRGMAVLENHQKKGIGKALMFAAEDYVKNKSANLIWLNARENASPFYTSLLYTKKGTSFEIANIGKHFVMYKII